MPDDPDERDGRRGRHDLDDRDDLDEALDLIGDRWSLAVIGALLHGSQRFGELQTSVAGIAPNILSQRLRQLVANGLVLARPYSRRPLRVTYELTAFGESLRPVVHALEQWGSRRGGRAGRVHDACGSPIELRWWCATCERAVDVDHDELHHL